VYLTKDNPGKVRIVDDDFDAPQWLIAALCDADAHTKRIHAGKYSLRAEFEIIAIPATTR